MRINSNILKVFLAVFTVGALSCSQENPQDTIGYETTVYLSGVERDWVNSNIVKIGIQTSFGPFMFVDIDKSVYGITKDYLELVAEKTSLRYEFILFTSLEEGSELYKAGKIDLFPAIKRTSEIEEIMSFTEPYMSYGSVMLIKQLPLSTPIKVAYAENFSIGQFLAKNSPELSLVIASSDEDAFRRLVKGEVEGVVLNVASADWLEFRFNTNFTRLLVDFEHRYTFGYKKDKVVLGLILEKGIQAITDEEKTKIINKWKNYNSVQFIQKDHIKKQSNTAQFVYKPR